MVLERVAVARIALVLVGTELDWVGRLFPLQEAAPSEMEVRQRPSEARVSEQEVPTESVQEEKVLVREAIQLRLQERVLLDQLEQLSLWVVLAMD